MEEFDIGRRLGDVNGMIRHRFEKYFKETGLNGTQAPILHFLSDNQGKRDIFQRDLEQRFHIRPSSVTSVLHTMEKKGLVFRESVATDARLKRIRLTAEGEKMAAVAIGLTVRVNSDLLRGLSSTEVQELDRLLQKVSDNIEG